MFGRDRINGRFKKVGRGKKIFIFGFGFYRIGNWVTIDGSGGGDLKNVWVIIDIRGKREGYRRTDVVVT